MEHFIFLTSLLFFLIFFYIIFIKYGEKTEVSKITFSKCEDKSIIEAFKKINITGKEYMQQQLLINNSSAKIIMKKKEGTGAGVRLNKIFLRNSFNDDLYLETFRDVLHESKHIIDKNLFLVNLFLVYISGALLSILCLLTPLKFIIHNDLINLLRLILSITLMILFSFQTMIHITLENNAIRYVVISCNDKLKGFEFEDSIIRKIYEYLSLQACYISEWYTMNLVSTLFFIFGLLFILALV